MRIWSIIKSAPKEFSTSLSYSSKSTYFEAAPLTVSRRIHVFYKDISDKCLHIAVEYELDVEYELRTSSIET